MSMGEFEALRSDLAAFRTEVNTRFARVEAKLDEKPSAGLLYQVSFGAPIALAAFVAAILTIAAPIL